MPKLKVPSLKNALLFKNDPALSESTLPSAPLSLQLNEEIAQELSEAGDVAGGVRVVAGLGAQLQIVNDARDPNVEDLFDFGLAPEIAAEVPEAAPALEPPVRFNPAKAYLVLTGISASGKLSGSGEVPALRVGLDATANLSVATCTEFDREVKLNSATDEVFEHFKTVFSLDDLEKLRPQETLVLAYGGSLKLSLQLSAACLVDAVGAGLQAALLRAVPVNLAVSPKASLDVRVEVTDGYRLYVQKHDSAEEWIVGVRKASSRVLGASASAGVKVDLGEGRALADAVSSSLALLTGLPGKAVDELLARLNVDELSAEQQSWVEKAVKVLGLENPKIPAWRAFRQMVETVNQRARAVIPQKVAASFTYSWRRITSDSYVARVRLGWEALREHHAKLLRLDFAQLIEESKEQSADPKRRIVFDRFLGKNTRRVEIGYGFSFGLNDFTFLKGWDTRSSRYITLRDLDGRVQVSFLGKRGYESSWIGQTESHAIEIDASMARFIAPPARPRDFEVGYHVAFSWKNQAIGAILPEVADHAAIIKAVTSSRVPDTIAALNAVEDFSQIRGDVSVSLLVPPSVSDLVLAQMVGPERDLLLAQALARALPYGSLGQSYAVRRDVDVRTRAYAPFWDFLLKNPDTEDTMIPRAVAKVLNEHEETLARQEQSLGRQGGWSVESVVYYAHGPRTLRKACDELILANSLLATRASSAQGPELFEKVLRSYSLLGGERFGARVLASLLCLAAERQPGALARVARKVTFQWTNDQALTRVIEFKLGDETM
jgi:hypothetical protein